MRVASDIGGTFTDLVYLDESTGITGACKTSTTPGDLAAAVIETLQKARFAVSATSFFVHGSTVVINTLTERKGARTGLITTQGFRDVLEITRANRPDLYNLYYRKPPPFVPRRYRVEVGERLNHRGEVLVALNEAQVEQAVAFFQEEGIESIAVCFLHSYANPVHELTCRDIVARLAPDIPVTISSEITQEWREYERTSTSVLNAYVMVITRTYLNNLEQKLTKMGMGNVFYTMQSNGGTATFSYSRSVPIKMVESGPVGGVIGAAAIGKAIGEPAIISFDVGGTTAKTSLVAGGDPRIVTSYRIEGRGRSAGYPLLIPAIDIVEIGSGGGSLAWVDAAGALRIGPQSAGADPGPACYGRGGEAPTVTDANVLAGRINPGYFLGGEIPLQVELAAKAIRPVAQAYGIDVREAAVGVLRLADSAMMNALNLVSVTRGYDPRDFVMVAFGGGGPMHAGSMIRELKLKKVVIPVDPGVFSAWGMLVTDLRQDFVRTLITRTDQVLPGVIAELFEDLEAKALELMSEQRIPLEMILLRRFADVRYHGQEHTVKVPIENGPFDESALRNVDQRFHELHEQAYSFRLEAPTEIVNFHISCFGTTSKPTLGTITPGGLSRKKAQKGYREVHFNEFGVVESPLYERALLPLEEFLEGPLVIEEPASTTVVFPDQRVMRDCYGFIHIEMVKD
jgi:N-methylhydantoinase A